MFHTLTGRRPNPDDISFFRSLFGSNLWQPRGWVWLAGFFLSLVWFDVVWCMATTFTAFSRAETYVNALLLAMVLALPAMLWHSRWLSLLLLVALDIWLECNLLYSRTYFTAIPLSSYALAGNLADFASSVTDSLRLPDIGFAAILVLTLIFGWKRGRRTRKVTLKSRLAYGTLLLFVALVSGSLLMIRGGLRKAWDDLEDCYHFSCRVPMFTLAGSMTNDALVERSVISESEKEEVTQWLAAAPQLTSLPDSVGGKYDNIVLILCESLESWPIGLTLEGKEITPTLNSLVGDTANTLYVPNVLTQVGAGRSIDAQLLIEAGMLPMQGGVYSMKAPLNEYLTLPKAMKELRGSRNYLLSVDKPVVWNQGAVASSFGIDTLLMKDSWTIDEKAGGYRLKLGDRSFLRQITEKASKGEIWPEGEPAFVQIITYSGHNPFTLSDELDNLKLSGEYPEVARNYMRTAHYTDEGLGILMGYLRSRSDYGRTLIVITGDHEGLADYRRHLAATLPYVSPCQLTPLIVVNSPVGGRIDKLVGQIDIYPTILKLAGLTDYPWHGMGRDITSSDFRGVAVSPSGELQGDTVGLSPTLRDHLMKGRRVSDRILRYNLLDKEEEHLSLQ